ncbi:thiamine pyrophosphate-binding protein [Candidatus Solincola tengchongensis]|uniref:thiamine pyrophosphate-binding protein n=1 Tax=Candidatus Solincola tengchongensis TaxID=2900693 RepID=UPI00257FDDA3|nr:thiamine pyrophosphate-binding protein [Candidatus Solincola tengchongensis]
MVYLLNGGDLVARTLAQEGVEHFIGIVGGQVLPLFDAVGRYPGLRLVVPRNEAAGAMMADGYARASGRPAVIISTVGAGIIYSAAGTAGAWADHVPIFSISPQVQTWKMYPAQESLQGCYQAEMMAGVTRWHCIAYSWKRIPRLVQRALREAMSGEKGPVHMDVPVDVFYETHLLTERKLRRLIPPPGRSRFEGRFYPASEDLREAAAIMETSLKPLLVAGMGVLRESAWEAVSALAERLALPVAVTPAALSAVIGDDPSFAGILGHPALPGLEEVVGQADTVVFLGATVSEQEAVLEAADLSRAKVIQTSPQPELLGALGKCDAAMAGDVASIARCLVDAARDVPGERRMWREKAREAYLRDVQALKEEAVGNSPGRAISSLGEDLGPGDYLVLDGKDAGYWGTLLCPARSAATRIRSWGLRGAGYGLPMALGVKLARPRDRVVALCDTEALMHHIQELDTARREDIRVVVCVVGERYRWREVAEGFGLHGEEASTPAELMVALERAEKSGRAAVIDLTGFEAGSR